MGNKLYVGNLSFNTDEASLQALFSQAGELSEVSVIMDRMTNRSRGFAFITYVNNDDAQKAVGMFNGKELDGRALVVNEAKPQVKREGGFGGGERRGGFGGGDRDRRGGGDRNRDRGGNRDRRW
jgi:RNA recognition motif-containing protein